MKIMIKTQPEGRRGQKPLLIQMFLIFDSSERQKNLMILSKMNGTSTAFCKNQQKSKTFSAFWSWKKHFSVTKLVWSGKIYSFLNAFIQKSSIFEQNLISAPQLSKNPILTAPSMIKLKRVRFLFSFNRMSENHWTMMLNFLNWIISKSLFSYM